MSRSLFGDAYDVGPPQPERMRAAPRQSVLLTTTIEAPELDGPISARVRNVSASGTLVETARPLPLGLKVALALRGVGDVTGVVVWATDSRAGIKFNMPINPEACKKPVSQGD
jgi:hypothetical protein